MANSKKRGVLHTYRSYNFVDKDPVTDAVRTAISDSGLSYTKLQALSTVNTGTIRNWLHGKTKRPQFCTVWAVARACGKRGMITGRDGKPKFID